MQPAELYLKAKRALLVASGLLILSITVGVDFNSGGTGLPVKLSDASRINDVFAVMAIYFSIQSSLFWAAQNDEVKSLIQYKVDFFLTMFIAAIAICLWSYIWISIGLNFVTAKLDLFAPHGTPQRWLAMLVSAMSALAGTLFLMMQIASRARRALTQQASKHLKDESRITDMLESKNWTLLFNPNRKGGGTKSISFGSNGEIDDGKNKNENRWVVRGKFLEILNDEGRVFSRFVYDENEAVFKHTNDDDTLSIRSQRIVPA